MSIFAQVPSTIRMLSFHNLHWLKKMKSLVFTLLCLFSWLATVVLSTRLTQQTVDAIDAATAEYVSGADWQDVLISHGLVYFSAPYCNGPKPNYPERWTLGNNHRLHMCYEVAAGTPWEDLHQKAAFYLVQTLNRHYGANITYDFQLIDTARAGYFPAMMSAVNNGSCDVAIASTNYDSDRASQVHFQCR